MASPNGQPKDLIKIKEEFFGPVLFYTFENESGLHLFLIHNKETGKKSFYKISPENIANFPAGSFKSPFVGDYRRFRKEKNGQILISEVDAKGELVVVSA